jgi:hypothetical protein
LLLGLGLLGLLLVGATLSGCGSSGAAVSIVPATDGLAKVVGAGKVLSCLGSSKPGCTPEPEVPVVFSPADGGQRLAVLYGDGHAVVWDVATAKALLSTAAQPQPGPAGLAEGLWLSGDGNALALNVGPAVGGTVTTQVWSVPRRRIVQVLSLQSAWVYADADIDKTVVVPNPVSGTGFLYVSLKQEKVLARPSVPSVAIVAHAIPSKVLAPTALAFDAKANEFVISSDAIGGFLTWSSRSGVKETKANCGQSGTLSSDAQEFACPTLVGRASFMSIWDVASHRQLAEWWMPGISPTDPPGPAVFINDDHEIAVPAGRTRGDDEIEVFRLSDHHLVDTVPLRPAPAVFSSVDLTVVGHDLVVEQDLGRSTPKEWLQVFRVS